MESKVTVLTPNGRRQNIKVTPNTTLLQILEEACQKHGFDSDEYCLKHHNKEVGLTQMFRFSGLPNNCLLEMYQAERKRVTMDVDICVQLEDGSRVQGQFKPNVTLWQVVELLSADAASSYDSPVVIYMRQEIVGKSRLEETTLKSLGIIEGRAMIRFINKNPEELKTQANVYVAPAAKETKVADDADNANAMRSTAKAAGGGGGFAITKDLVQSLKKANSNNSNEQLEPMDTTQAVNAAEVEQERPKYDWGTGVGHTIRTSDTELAAREAAERAAAEQLKAQMDMEPEPEVVIIGERNAILYSLDATQKQVEDLPDSFFDLTVQDLKLVLRDLKKISTGNEDAPLMTERLRELEANNTMLNKIAQYKNCVIRVQFPDRYVLQGMFKPVEKISHVEEFVRKFLQNKSMNFHLFTIPPKSILPLDKTLLELDCVPTAVVHFAAQEDDDIEQNYLKPELLTKLTSAEGAFYAANKFRISNRKASSDEVLEGSEFSLIAQYERKSPDPSTGAIPKRPRNDEQQKQAI